MTPLDANELDEGYGALEWRDSSESNAVTKKASPYPCRSYRVEMKLGPNGYSGMPQMHDAKVIVRCNS